MIWKIYFWVAAALLVLALLVGGADVKYHLALVDILDFVVLIVGLIGIYGYAFKHAYGSKNLWIVITVAVVVYHSLFSFILDQKFGAAPAVSLSDALSTFLPFVPLYVGLYFYTFRNKALSS